MKMTSAQANKLLNRLKDDLNYLLTKEAQSHVFNAAVGEDIEDIRPEYSYINTQAAIDALEKKIRKVKHAINVFNTTTVLPELDITIDEALILIPQLTKKRNKLNEMKSRLPRTRVNNFHGSNVIDYEIVNYNISQVEEDYDIVVEELAALQTALDEVNNSETLDITL